MGFGQFSCKACQTSEALILTTGKISISVSTKGDGTMPGNDTEKGKPPCPTGTSTRDTTPTDSATETELINSRMDHATLEVIIETENMGAARFTTQTALATKESG